MISEAKLGNGEPQGPGLFVLNARDARWSHNELGAFCPFEGKDAPFEQLGINLNVLPPGMPMAMYHEEPGQEEFLVLRGECVLIVEGEVRRLATTWDFVHCPPHTKHVIVGAGTDSSLVLALGARKGQAGYPVDEAALRHGAGVERETRSPAEAYARFSRPADGPAPEL